MTDLDRLLAAGDALADAASDMVEENPCLCLRLCQMCCAMRSLVNAWQALAREVRKEKGDDT